MPRSRYTTGPIRQPWSRRKRITVITAGCIGAIAIFGTIADATASSEEQQYKTCIASGYTAKYCYDDVWNGGHQAPSLPPSTPKPAPTTPPATPNINDTLPTQHGHFTFCAECPLDATQVIDLR